MGLGPPAGGRVRVMSPWVRILCRWDMSGVLLFEVPVGCLHVSASWQSLSRCSCRLREVLVEEAVLRPFGKL